MRSKFKWIFSLFIAFTMQFSFAQEKTVSGVVSDETGPLPAANVVVKGTNRSTQTDFDGKYSIKASEGEVLVFSFTGYENSNQTVGSSSKINVKLTTGIKLKEVVIGGYKTYTKTEDVTASQTITAKTIENRPNASFVQTLQGQIAGVNVTTGSGQPGSASSVIIRGVSTILGNTDPLYVIDGLPTTADNFRSINPNDIESTTVLKDAAATSVYGNRGTNGVIIIKTKSGSFSESKTRFRYSVTTGLTELQSARYPIADVRELLTLEKRFARGRGASLTDEEIAATTTETDWLDYFFRTGVSSEHQFSIETSSKNVNSFSSVSYLDQQGILDFTGIKRFTLRNNLNGRSNNEKFTYSTNISLGFTRNNLAGSVGTGGVNNNYLIGAVKGVPYLSPSDYTTPQALVDLQGEVGGLSLTPLFLIDKQKTFGNTTDEFRLITSGELGYKIMKNVEVKSRTSIEYIQFRGFSYTHPNSFNGIFFLETNPVQEFGGAESYTNRREVRFNNLWQIEYEKIFAKKHKIGVSGNAEFYKADVDNNAFTQNGLDPRTYVPGVGSGWQSDEGQPHDWYVPGVSASKLRTSLISYFGIFDYDFDQRFGLSASYRYDGTNRFAEDYQWGSFWSVGGRWNISNESFLKDSEILPVLKLRASYGVTGNQRIIDGTEFAGLNPQPYKDTFSNVANVYNSQVGLGFNLGVDDLQWENTYTANIGVDFEMFKSRLRGSVDVYERKTKDLFYEFPISPITGQSTITKNTDIVLTNSGVDLNLAYDLIRNDNTRLTLRGNINYNKNEVSNIRFNNGRYPDGNYITANGTQANEYYVVRYAGVNPLNGNLLFYDKNNNLTENPNVDSDLAVSDRVETGKSPIPIYQGGFGYDFEYKGFFSSSNFTFVKDAWRFDFDLGNFYDPAQLGNFNVSDDLLNAWTPTNTNTNIPSLSASNAALDEQSDRFLKDASYVRLRYLQVGYRVPKKFLEKTFLSSVSFFVQGENLVTWTKWQGFDAESPRFGDQGQYPTPRIYSFGIDLKF